MGEADESYGTCDSCGATIYPEHIARGAAERQAGKLLCMHCVGAKRSPANAGTAAAAQGGSKHDTSGGGIALAPEDDAHPTEAAANRSHGTAAGVRHERSPFQGARLTRPLLPRGSTNATRCKTFHCKLSDPSIVHLNDQINEWADVQEDVEIKFATSTIGVVEGKHNDAHLIVTVFY